MKEMIPLSLRQRKAFVWWARREYEDYAAIICDGAIRSGKTLAMGMGFSSGRWRAFPTGSSRCAGGAWARCGATAGNGAAAAAKAGLCPARRSGAKSF